MKTIDGSIDLKPKHKKMTPLHVENYPGTNGEDFKIRIFDNTNKFETAINLLLMDNNEEREINIKRYEDSKDIELSDLITKAKKQFN